MITFRTRPEFGIDWTLISVDGENEEAVASILKARLDSADWTILVSREGGEFVPMDELEWDDE